MSDHIAIPAPIFDAKAKLTNPAAGKARDLHNDILASSVRLRDIEDRHRTAVGEMRAAEEALLAQAREPGYDAHREVELADELKAARVLADPPMHHARVNAEQARFDRAIHAYKTHCQAHLAELLAELTPEAEAATAELAKARAAVAPLAERYSDSRRRVERLLKHVRPARVFTSDEIADNAAWNLPEDESVPLPNPAVVEAWTKIHTPAIQTPATPAGVEA
jgi:hypothetical protein